jgi:P2-related tail formation protein
MGSSQKESFFFSNRFIDWFQKSKPAIQHSFQIVVLDKHSTNRPTIVLYHILISTNAATIKSNKQLPVANYTEFAKM